MPGSRPAGSARRLTTRARLLPGLALLALVAVLSLQDARPAQAQSTAIWSATLTLQDEGGILGCSNGSSTTAVKCSTTTTLSEDEFTIDGTPYDITQIQLDGSTFYFDVDVNPFPRALAAYTLFVDGVPFPLELASRDFGSQGSISWSGIGLTWAADQSVALELRPTAPIWEATLRPTNVQSGAYLGCRNTESLNAGKCSATGRITDDDFPLLGTDLSVVDLSLRNSDKFLRIAFDASISDRLKNYALNIGGKQFPLSTATISTHNSVTGSIATWQNSGLSWTAGTPVRASLKPTAPTITSVTPGAADGGPTLTVVTSNPDSTRYDVVIQIKKQGSAFEWPDNFGAAHQLPDDVSRDATASSGNSDVFTGLEAGTAYTVRAHLRNKASRSIALRNYSPAKAATTWDVPGAPAAPAGAVTTVWSTTLTVDVSGSEKGCDNDPGGLDNCISANPQLTPALADGRFTFDGKEYRITSLYTDGSGNLNMGLGVSGNPSPTLRGGSLRIGTTDYALSSGFRNSYYWSGGPSWNNNQPVTVEIVVPASEPTVTAGDAKLTLNWAAPRDTGGRGASVTGYAVEHKTAAAADQPALGTAAWTSTLTVQDIPGGGRGCISSLGSCASALTTSSATYATLTRAVQPILLNEGELVFNVSGGVPNSWMTLTLVVDGTPFSLGDATVKTNTNLSWPTDITWTANQMVSLKLQPAGTDPADGWVPVTHSGTGTSAEITGLTNGTSYDARVRALNGIDPGGPWASGQGTPQASSTKTYSIADATGFEGFDASLTVTLGEAAPTGGVTFSVTTNFSDQTAVAADLGAVPTTVTVASGETTANLTIPLVKDNRNESDETFEVTITTTASGWTASDGTAAVTITDTTIPVRFNPSTQLAPEGAFAKVFMEATEDHPDSPFTVTVTATAGTATSATDYDAGPWNVTFPAGVNVVSFNIGAVKDTLDDDEETFTLTISTAGDSGASVASPGTATVTIVDTIWAAQLSAKNLGTSGFGCDNSQTTAANKCTSTALDDDDFTLGGTDYDIVSFTINGSTVALTLDANIPDALKTHTLLVDGRELDLGDATISGASATWTGATLAEPYSAASRVSLGLRPPTATPPTITFSQAVYKVSEADGQAQLTLNASPAPSSDLRVLVEVANTDVNTATAGTDFTGTAWSVDFLTGSSTAGFIIPIASDDASGEGTEFFNLLIRPGTGYTTNASSQTRVDITEPSTRTAIWDATLTVKTVTGGKGCAAATGIACSETAVLTDNDFTLAGDTTTYTFSSFYVAASGTLTFQMFNVQFTNLYGYTLLVGGEPFPFVMADYKSGFPEWHDSGLTWVADQQVELKVVPYARYEDGSRVLPDTKPPGKPEFGTATTGSTSITYTWNGIPYTRGDCGPVTDYMIRVSLADGTFVKEHLASAAWGDPWGSGGTAHSATVTGLKPSTTYHARMNARTMKGCRSPASDVKIETTPATQTGQSPGSSEQQQDAPGRLDMTCHAVAAVKAATNYAAVDADTTRPGSVTVIPGDGTLTVTWTLTPREGVPNGDIKHALRWSQTADHWDNPTDPWAIGPSDGLAAPCGATSVTIRGLTNGSMAAVMVRSFTGKSYLAHSNQSSGWVKVEGASTTPSANANAQEQGSEPDQSSAAALSELNVTSYAFTEAFDPARTQYAITVPSTMSGVWLKAVAKDSTATVSIAGARAYAGGVFYVPLHPRPDAIVVVVTAEDGTTLSYRIGIDGDVTPRAFSLTATARTTEGSDATLTITLSKPAPSGGVTFTVKEGYSSNVTATAADVGSVASPVTVAEGSTTLNISIPTVDDDGDEGDETFFVVVTPTTKGWSKTWAGTDRDTATITITDNDTAGMTITPTNLSVDEDGSAIYFVALDTKPTADVTITAAVSDGGAASVTPASLTFTLAEWDMVQDFTVSGVSDADGVDESVSVSHGVTSTDAKYNGIAAASVAVSVSDSAAPPSPYSDASLRDLYVAAHRFTEPFDPARTEYATTVGQGTSRVYVRARVNQEKATAAITGVRAIPGGWYIVPLDPRPDVIAVVVTAEDGTTTRIYRIGIDGELPTSEEPPQQQQQQEATPKTFSVGATASATEGSNATLTVTLSEAAPSGGVALTVTAGYGGDSTATASDVGSITSPVTVAAGNTTLDITIPTASDDVDEDDETFTVTIAATTEGWDKAGDGRDTATITITDDDTAGITVTAANPLNVDEGGSGTYTVVLASKPTHDVTIAASGSDGGAASVAPTSYTFTPSNWNTARTFTVSGVTDDDTVDERVGVSHRVTTSDAKYAAALAPSVSVSVKDTTAPPQRQQQQEGTGPPIAGQTEPYNVQITPGDGTLTVTWSVAPREGVSIDRIRHALRWSQVSGVWANPRDPWAGGPEDGVAVEGGVARYTITGLTNGVATGVFVRSFTGGDQSERSRNSSKWVRVKGEQTTPASR